jgi:hypothetical protein
MFQLSKTEGRHRFRGIPEGPPRAAGCQTSHLLALARTVAERALPRCDRVLLPLTGGPDEHGGCFSCGGSPQVRVSLRLDGAELFWALACRAHQHDELHVAVSC